MKTLKESIKNQLDEFEEKQDYNNEAIWKLKKQLSDLEKVEQENPCDRIKENPFEEYLLP